MKLDRVREPLKQFDEDAADQQRAGGQLDVLVTAIEPCTTALRTMIDLGPELSGDELRRAVDDCLTRRLFTVEEAMARTAEPDMRDRVGARLLERVLGRPSTG